MTENSNVTYHNPENVSTVFIYVFLLLSIDYAFFQFLPKWLDYAPRFLSIFFIILQAYRAYRITRIPELLVVSTSVFIIFLRLPSIMTENITPIPPESYNGTFLKIMVNLLVISLILPWNWLSYQLIKSKAIRAILVFTTILTYPVVLVGQFNQKWGGNLYIFAVLFLLSWFLFATIQSKPFYKSHRNIRGKQLIILTQICFLFPFILLLSVPTVFTLSLAHLGLNIWLLLTWYTVTSYPYAFFLTQEQTARAAGTFYDVKATHEKIECMIFDNVDRYLRKIPEDSILAVDNDKLTLMWIGLQRK